MEVYEYACVCVCWQHASRFVFQRTVAQPKTGRTESDNISNPSADPSANAVNSPPRAQIAAPNYHAPGPVPSHYHSAAVTSLWQLLDCYLSARWARRERRNHHTGAAAIVARYGKSVRLLGLIRETLIKVKLGRTSSSPERFIIPPGDCDSDICGRPSFCISKTFVRAKWGTFQNCLIIHFIMTPFWTIVVEAIHITSRFMVSGLNCGFLVLLQQSDSALATWPTFRTVGQSSVDSSASQRPRVSWLSYCSESIAVSLSFPPAKMILSDRLQSFFSSSSVTSCDSWPFWQIFLVRNFCSRHTRRRQGLVFTRDWWIFSLHKSPAG